MNYRKFRLWIAFLIFMLIYLALTVVVVAWKG